MEIYKLKDKVPEKRELRTVSDGAVSSFVITDMKSGVKNPNRVNVYVNHEFAFSLDVAQVVDFKVKVGRVLSGSEFEELKKASEFGKLYQRALEWTLTRPRSRKEVYDYLYKKVYEKKLDKGIIGDVINRLAEKHYINDQKFAEFYVENRFVKKGVSQKRLKMELIKKGVSQEIIDEVLSGRNDEEEIMKMIAKKRAKYSDDEKMISYLCRQGFPFELVRSLVQTYEKD